MTTQLLVLSALLAASSGGVVFARRAQGKRRELVERAQEAAPAVDAIGELLTRALAEQEAFEADHRVPFDWHQRRHSVCHRLERMLHEVGQRVDVEAVRAAVENAIPHPPLSERV